MLKRATTTVVLLLSMLLLGASGLPLAHAAAPRLLVVVAASLSVHDMPLATLRRVFRGDLVVIDGVRLVPFNYAPQDPLRLAFDEVALGMNADQVGRYWIDRRIRGQGMPPRTAPNPTLLKAVVSKLPGAIGYIPAEHLDASIRAVTLDGKAYSAPGYPLAP